MSHPPFDIRIKTPIQKNDPAKQIRLLLSRSLSTETRKSLHEKIKKLNFFNQKVRILPPDTDVTNPTIEYDAYVIATSDNTEPNMTIRVFIAMARGIPLLTV